MFSAKKYTQSIQIRTYKNNTFNKSNHSFGTSLCLQNSQLTLKLGKKNGELL